MTELSQLVDLAACLSLSANTPDAHLLADRKRDEAMQAIELEQAKLNRYKAILTLFPQKTPVKVEFS